MPPAGALPANLPPAGERAGSAALTLVHGVPWLAGYGHSLPTWLVAQPPSAAVQINTAAPAPGAIRLCPLAIRRYLTIRFPN